MAKKLSRRTLARHVAAELAGGADQKKLARQLAAYLIDARRTREVRVLLRDIQTALAENGHVAGTIVSAVALSRATIAAIEAFAKAETGAATVSLDTVVDAAVIGGIKLELPGHELDTTIARRLTTLKTKYRKA